MEQCMHRPYTLHTSQACLSEPGQALQATLKDGVGEIAERKVQRSQCHEQQPPSCAHHVTDDICSVANFP